MNMKWSHGWIRQSQQKNDTNTPIIKIGGSLLLWPHWPIFLSTLIKDFDGAPIVIIGGGAIVNGLRQIDRAAPQSQEMMHNTALDCMHVMARLISDVLDIPLSNNPVAETSPCILDVPQWLACAPCPRNLPKDWSVTSDSIAAYVATEYETSLTLVKSSPPPRSSDMTTLQSLADSGWVDAFFPFAAAEISNISWLAPTQQ